MSLLRNQTDQHVEIKMIVFSVKNGLIGIHSNVTSYECGKPTIDKVYRNGVQQNCLAGGRAKIELLLLRRVRRKVSSFTTFVVMRRGGAVNLTTTTKNKTAAYVHDAAAIVPTRVRSGGDNGSDIVDAIVFRRPSRSHCATRSFLPPPKITNDITSVIGRCHLRPIFSRCR